MKSQLRRLSNTAPFARVWQDSIREPMRHMVELTGQNSKSGNSFVHAFWDGGSFDSLGEVRRPAQLFNFVAAL